ncbi:endothelin-2 [Nothobranchius furzeri]|uniref:Endothelin 2 n=1 Tax=Nothobranchius furzeri TaxID=105023 RepID=A0A8C6ME96_NOTFU|nr:endothelin-2 [Nothobranchius furzeri]KAF7211567.1 endothelin-2-like [Nothobranchius furzeri]
MTSLLSKILTLLFTCMALREGWGLPLSDRPEAPLQVSHPNHIRTKRCSCNSWYDTECIYFCHLDIIWVNTPSKLLPHGLGGSLSRRRRSANRCQCSDLTDKRCRAFCYESSEDSRAEDSSLVKKSTRANSKQLLASLRSLVQSNMKIAKASQSSRADSSGEAS